MSYTHYYPSSSLFHCSMDNIMGTRLDMVMVGVDLNHLTSVWQKIERRLSDLNLLMSRFDERSELHRLNRTAPSEYVSPASELWNILDECIAYHRSTSGYFDITLGKFNALKRNMEDRTIHFNDENMYLDLGGYGKGYALKQIESLLDQEKVEDAFVDFGNSSILAKGRHPYGECWSVSVADPYHGNPLSTFRLKNCALTVSGNTPAHPRHIFNPITGTYKQDRLLVAVQTADPVLGEVLSTSGFLMDSPERFDKLLSSFTIIDKQYIEI